MEGFGETHMGLWVSKNPPTRFLDIILCVYYFPPKTDEIFLSTKLNPPFAMNAGARTMSTTIIPPTTYATWVISEVTSLAAIRPVNRVVQVSINLQLGNKVN